MGERGGQFVHVSYNPFKGINLTVLGKKKKKKMHQFVMGGGVGAGVGRVG